MDTASAVVIEGVLSGESGAMGMAGDQNVIFLLGPMMETLLGFLFSRIIFRGAGGIQDAVALQRFPQIPDQKSGEAPERGIEQIRLVSVGEIDVFRFGRICVFKDDTGIEPDIRQERTIFQRRCVAAAVGIGIVAFHHISLFVFYNIVIAVDHMKPSLLVEAGEQIKYIAMGFYDLLHIAVFP